MESIITLTPVERLTLANQYRILAAQGDANAAQYARNAEIFRGGHTPYYVHVFADLAAEVPATVTAELITILNMFSCIHQMLAEHSAQEIEAAGLDHQKLAFKGFDLTHDEFALQAHMMAEHMGLYVELRAHRIGSHTADDMRRYRRMVPIYVTALQSQEGVSFATLKAMQDAA